jgi:hypothetical protein
MLPLSSTWLLESLLTPIPHEIGEKEAGILLRVDMTCGNI